MDFWGHDLLRDGLLCIVVGACKIGCCEFREAVQNFVAAMLMKGLLVTWNGCRAIDVDFNSHHVWRVILCTGAVEAERLDHVGRVVLRQNVVSEMRSKRSKDFTFFWSRIGVECFFSECSQYFCGDSNVISNRS